MLIRIFTCFIAALLAASISNASTITTRAGAGTTLTWTQLDTNFKEAAQAKAINYTILEGDNRDTIEFNGSSLTATLPVAATIAAAADTGDFEVTIKNLNATALTVARTSTDTIDGATSYSLAQYESATFKVNQGQTGYNVLGGKIFAAIDINGGAIDGVTIGASAAPTVTNLGTVTTADINGGTIDGVTIGGTSAAAGTFTSLNATGGGSLTGTWSNLGAVTTIDINGGTIDGATIGGTTKAAGGFTTLTATGASTLAGGSSSGTWSNLGAVTTVDINGGTIDGVTIGGTTKAAGGFTTLTATGASTLAGGSSSGTWSNLGAVTTVDINGGTIDGVTIGGTSAGYGTFLGVYSGTFQNTAGSATLAAGSGASGGYLTMNQAAASEGQTIATLWGYYSGVPNNSAIFYNVIGASPNAAAAALKIYGNSGTGRSINAGGTVNSSGADYAEYELVAEDSQMPAPGDIIGFDENGLVTEHFSKALGFGVVSTKPSFVGGDRWKASDRVALVSYSGKVPINVSGASPGDYIVPIETVSHGISAIAVSKHIITLQQLVRAVGVVRTTGEDGRPIMVVKSW